MTRPQPATVEATQPPGRPPAPDVEPRPVRGRHPADAARIVVAVAVLALLLGLGAAFSEGSRSTTVDLVRLFDHIPKVVLQFLVGGLQVLAVAAPLTLIGRAGAAASPGRPPRLGVALAAAVAAPVRAAGSKAFDDYVPQVDLDSQGAASWSAVPPSPSAGQPPGRRHGPSRDVVVSRRSEAAGRRAALVDRGRLRGVASWHRTQVPATRRGIPLSPACHRSRRSVLPGRRAHLRPLSTAADRRLLEGAGIARRCGPWSGAGAAPRCSSAPMPRAGRCSSRSSTPTSATARSCCARGSACG